MKGQAMKKIGMILAIAVSLYGADNDLYDNAVSLNVGYASTSATSASYSGVNYGLQVNRNLNTSEGTWNVDALQFSLTYANLNTAARDYALRLGSNALWYIENYSDWTPYIKAGVGLQFVSGTEEIAVGNHFYGTLGAGMEYQLRGDTSLLGEVTDHLSASGENTVRLAAGVKYSFGQSY